MGGELAKLTPPYLGRVVPRERLYRLLDAAFDASAVWLGAPAGSGKTTAIVAYLAVRTTVPVWYRVDAGDLDLAAFFYSLAQSLPAKKRAKTLPIFGAEYASKPLPFARRFFRAYYDRLPAASILVFDDLHVAAATLLPDIVAIAVEELPPDFRIVFVTREQIPGSFAGLRANNRLARVDERALLFDDAEAEALLNARLGERVDAHVRQAAQQGAQGWAAGLVLMSEQAAQGADFTARYPAHHGEPLFDYFANEVFERMSEPERHFMQVTALVSEVDPGEAAAMTGRSDAQDLLDAFCQRQLFVTRLAGRIPRYQYHDLFRAFLLARLYENVVAGELRDTRIRAAEAVLEGSRIESAIALFIDAQAWQRAAEQVEHRAQTLLQQGRRATLLSFVGAIPPEVVADYPWLHYWMGVATMIDDAATACGHFERAYAGFAVTSDPAAMSLTAAQAVLAIHMSWGTHVGTAAWLERLDQTACAVSMLRASDRLRVATAAVRAAGMTSTYRVNEASVAAVVETAVAMLEARSARIDVNDRMVAADALQEHASALGSPDLFQRIVGAVTPALADPGLTPWAKCHWLVSFASVSGRRFPYHKDRFPYATPEDALHEAWLLANEHGLPNLCFAATFAMISVARGAGNHELCERLVAKLQAEYDPAQPTQTCNFFFHQSMQFGVNGDYQAALAALVSAEEAATRAQLPLSEWWTLRASRAQILIALGRFDEAIAVLRAHAPEYSGLFLQVFQILIATAQWLKAPHGTPEHVIQLRALLADVREAGWANYMTMIPAAVSQVWGEALEHGIERNFIVAAIRRRKLRPPNAYSAAWPWPLRVRLLGPLQIERDDEPLRFGAKMQKKPFELLKLLASAAHRAVDAHQIMAWLWPEADTESAKASLDVTVHRLRKILGIDEALVLTSGKLQLATEMVWVDAAAFEHWLDEAQRRLDAQPERPEANILAERLFADYRGRLCGDDEPAPWSIGLRERLHHKFLQLAGSLGRFYEVQRDFIRALAVYRRGLAEDQLAEEFYRGLIRCQLAQNEPAAALHTFRSCREILSVVLGVSPAPATVALASKIRGAAS
jgi:LuxR family transcriptional regulator, maltose regulon positive regulatory protein